MADSQLTKTCTKCKVEKPVSEFNKAPRGKYGVSAKCRDCCRAVGREYMRKIRSGNITPTKRTSDTLTGMKRCPRCLCIKTLEDFPIHKNTKDGRFGFCVPCRIAYNRKRRASRSSKDAVRVALLDARDTAQATAGPGFKWCWQCHKIKDALEFEKSNRSSDGLKPYCKPCARLRMREYDRKMRSISSEYRARKNSATRRSRKNPEVRARIREYNRLPNVISKSREYNQSEHGRALRREAVSRWQKSELGKESRRTYERLPRYKNRKKQYLSSDRGKTMTRAARKRFYSRLRKGDLPRLGTPDNPHPSDIEIVRSYQSGHTTYEIAESVGRTPTGVTYRLLRNGVPLRDGFTKHLRYDDRILCLDGDRVTSQYECAVDNWLSRHNIAHTLEPKLPFSGRRMRADFLVGNIYIEVWGMIGSKSYDERRKEKLDLYTKYAVELIEVFPSDLRRGNFSALHKLTQTQN